MSKEVQLRVADAKQRDVGHGKVRIDNETMQKLAREMNFSETVFVLPPEAGGHARIRIFTPAVELPFAGHPVLGSAFVLGMPLQLDEIHLETGAGIIPVALDKPASTRNRNQAVCHSKG